MSNNTDKDMNNLLEDIRNRPQRPSVSKDMNIENPCYSRSKLLEEIRNRPREPTFEEKIKEMSQKELGEAYRESKRKCNIYEGYGGRITITYQLMIKEEHDYQELIMERMEVI